MWRFTGVDSRNSQQRSPDRPSAFKEPADTWFYHCVGISASINPQEWSHRFYWMFVYWGEYVFEMLSDFYFFTDVDLCE